MRKRTGELSRIERLIKNDRLNVKDDFSYLLKSDIDRVLKDYFEYKGLPTVEIERSGEGFTVKVQISAGGVKPFSVVPEEDR